MRTIRYTVKVRTPDGYDVLTPWAVTAADAREQTEIRLRAKYPGGGGWAILEVRPNSIQGEP